MLILSPQLVRFASAPMPGVTAIAIDRAATRLIEERADEGPFPVFADVPEQRVTIQVTQTLASSDIPGPGLGEQGELEAWAASNRSAAGRIRVSAIAVITAVQSELTRGVGARPGSVSRTITFTALSSDGKNDPVTASEAGGGGGG